MSWSWMRRTALVALGLGAAVIAPHISYAGGGVPAGGGAASGGMPMFTVYSRHFQVQGPAAVTAGYVGLRYMNNGGVWSGAAIARLKPGATASQVLDAYRTNNNAAVNRLSVSVGGTGLKSGSELISNLQPGNYVIGDVEQPSKNRTIVAGRGFTVLPAAGAARPAPATTVMVHLVNFKFRMPSSVPAGMNTFELMNMGNQPHEMLLFKLNPGKTLADVISYLKSQQGPPPGQPVAGLFDLDPGQTSYLRAPIAAGSYVALCFVTDPKTHLPHAALGMIMPFTAR